MWSLAKNDNIISFYSCKLTSAKINYTAIETELLRIVETLKEFRTIILGHRITRYTNHKNLTYENYIIERVLI